MVKISRLLELLELGMIRDTLHQVSRFHQLILLEQNQDDTTLPLYLWKTSVSYLLFVCLSLSLFLSLSLPPSLSLALTAKKIWAIIL